MRQHLLKVTKTLTNHEIKIQVERCLFNMSSSQLLNHDSKMM